MHLRGTKDALSLVMTSAKIRPRFLSYLFVVASTFAWPNTWAASSSCPSSELQPRLISIDYDGPPLPQDIKSKIDTIANVGHGYCRQDVDKALSILEAYLKDSLGDQSTGSVSYLTISIQKQEGSSNDLSEVRVKVSPFSLEVGYVRPYSIKLKASSFQIEYPPSVRFNGWKISASQDSAFGSSLGLQSSTNGKPSTSGIQPWLAAEKTILKPFYWADAGFCYLYGLGKSESHQESQLQFSVSASSYSEPILQGSETVSAGRAELYYSWNDQYSPYKKFQAGASIETFYSRLTNLETANPILSGTRLSLGIERGLRLSGGEIITETNPVDDPTRKIRIVGPTLWDGYLTLRSNISTVMAGVLEPYQQFQASVGPSLEVGRGHDRFGLDIYGAFGFSTKSTPAFDLWYGGTVQESIYHPGSQLINRQRLAIGPIIRSIGVNQAGVLSKSDGMFGGSAYWNVSLTAAIPIGGWSRPLIPDVVMDDEDAAFTAGSWVKNKINDDGTIEDAIDSLVKYGNYTSEKAREELTPVFKKFFRPYVNHAVDHANLFAIRPLIMADIAKIYRNDYVDSTLWLGLGVGLQVELTYMRFVLGYMQTVSPGSQANDGNLFVRFVVLNPF